MMNMSIQDRLDAVLHNRDYLESIEDEVKRLKLQNVSNEEIAERFHIPESSVRFIVMKVVPQKDWYMDDEGYMHGHKSDVPMPIWDAVRKKFNKAVTARRRKEKKNGNV